MTIWQKLLAVLTLALSAALVFGVSESTEDAHPTGGLASSATVTLVSPAASQASEDSMLSAEAGCAATAVTCSLFVLQFAFVPVRTWRASDLPTIRRTPRSIMFKQSRMPSPRVTVLRL